MFETLAAAYDDASQVAIGQGRSFVPALRQALTDVAIEQRQTVVNLRRLEQPTGSFLPPQRLADGRVGYPLAGGRFWGRWGGTGPGRFRLGCVICTQLSVTSRSGTGSHQATRRPGYIGWNSNTGCSRGT